MTSWSETLTALRKGELEARDRVARLVIGTLDALGAYELRDSWDDVVQEVLITLLQHAPREPGDASGAAYIRRIATRLYLDRIRAERGRRRSGATWRRTVPLDEAESLPADDTSVEAALELDLARALEMLDPRLQRVIECKYRLGATDAEGAERLGESLGTYKRLAREALAELRRTLVSTGRVD